MPAAALAGGLGCSSDAAECYPRVRQADRHAAVSTPAIVATRNVRVEVAPGRWRAEHQPAAHAIVMRQVMIQSARAELSVTPPAYRSVHETIVVTPAAVRWERRLDRHGVETLCEVRLPAFTRTVAREVMASPGQRLARHVPALYRPVAEAVVVQPATVRHVYEPPVHRWIDRTYVVRVAASRGDSGPPEIATDRRQALVRRGEQAWQPVGGRARGHD